MSSITRRGFLHLGFAGLVSQGVAHRSSATQGDRRRPAKSCILLFLQGGSSHLDTFDPKPDAADSIRGPVGTIDTTVAGLRLSEHFPRLAMQAHELTLLRSLTSPEPDHERATYLLKTAQLPDLAASWPAVGAVAAWSRRATASALPGYVAIDPAPLGLMDAGFLGRAFDPFTVAASTPMANLEVSETTPERQASRLEALALMNRDFASRTDPARVAEFAESIERAARFANGTARHAFALEREPVANRARRYGRTTFGRGCLLARRLVEAGVPFVQVTLNGWDTHKDNFTTVSDLSARLDCGLSALLADLRSRGLLQSTLVVVVGEFGRTPTINADRGRDHWPRAFSAVLAGGGVRPGVIFGRTDARAAEVTERPVTLPELFASILSGLNIDLGHRHRTTDGRPVYLTERTVNGQREQAVPVTDLFL